MDFGGDRMRKLIAKLFGLPLAYTQDHDGEMRLRIVRRDPFGEYTVRGVVWFRIGFLKPDGSISNGSYLRKWKPANERAEELFK